MGFCKKCCISCLSCCCLIPMSWIAFNFFGLDAAITGGLLTNIGPALSTLAAASGVPGASVLVGGLIGFIMILIFPLHWMLYFRPDEPMFALAIIIPWVLMGFITSIIWAKSTKEGFMLPMITGILLIVVAIFLFQFALPFIATQAGVNMTPIFDSLFQGLAGLPDSNPLGDLPAVAIMILAILEGSLVGGVFGALAGAIRYDPASGTYQPKSSGKSKPSKTYQAFGQTTMPDEPKL